MMNKGLFDHRDVQMCSSSSKALLLNSILNVTQKRYKHVRAVDISTFHILLTLEKYLS